MAKHANMMPRPKCVPPGAKIGVITKHGDNLRDSAGVLDGDECVTWIGADYEDGDLIAVKMKTGDLTLGRFVSTYTNRPRRVRLRFDAGQAQSFKLADVEWIGRVVQVERGGEIVISDLRGERKIGRVEFRIDSVRCETEGGDARALRSLGLPRNGHFDLDTPARAPQPRQIIVAVRNGDDKWIAGRFVRFGHQSIVLDVPGGGETEYDLGKWAAYHFDDSTIKPGKTPNSERIAELRERLERLAERDEWEYKCGGTRFRLETEIYELEQADLRRHNDEWEGFDLVKA